MQIILLKDIAKLGHKGEIKEVKDGYAQYLIVQGVVERATPERIAALEKKLAEETKAADQKSHALTDRIKALDGKTITIHVPSNDIGHLYEKLDAAKLSALAPELPVEAIQLAEPIKEVGEYKIKLASRNREATTTVVLEAQK